MKIVVAYKWAANPQDASVGPDGTVDWGRAKAAFSEYDPVAAEVGRRLANATGGALIGITVGGKDVGSSLARKGALSRGLDRAVVLSDDTVGRPDSRTTAAYLAAIVRHIGDVDLVLTGDSSVDVGAKLVPPALAGELGWPCLAEVTSVTGTAGSLTIERAYAGGTQVLQATGPVVCAVATDAAVAPVPGMKDILAAAKKPVEEISLAALAVPEAGATLATTGRAKPQLKARKGQLIDGSDPDAAAAALVSALRTAGAL
ncbi:MAG: electron transfer flavoprotein subunit beta/FixA family protein [Dermatophilaceae bacterium]